MRRTRGMRPRSCAAVVGRGCRRGQGPSHTLNVRIDEDLRDELTERARCEGQTTSDVVREALRRYLAS